MSPRTRAVPVREAALVFSAFCMDCSHSPATRTEPQVVSVASAPSADAASAPDTKPTPRARVVVVRAGDIGRRLWSITADGKASPIELRGVELKYTLGRLGA